MTEYGPYPAKVVRIHDGDTITLDLDLGFNVSLLYNCRFAICNAPELGTPEGKAALAYLKTLIKPGDKVTAYSYGWDKYGGRFDGNVFKDGDSVSLSAHMIQSGHAVYTHYKEIE